MTETAKAITEERTAIFEERKDQIHRGMSSMAPVLVVPTFAMIRNGLKPFVRSTSTAWARATSPWHATATAWPGP